ncbi:PAS domain-containing protein [Maridesulfovibrio sp.]|uniref:PAS domain-containing protein n=1 Tax=unclassified Maridesulfovibrio TaxID=2794999 RepID=UPI003AFFA791
MKSNNQKEAFCVKRQTQNMPDESLGSMCASILASQGFALSVRGKEFEPIYVNDACLKLFGETRDEWMKDDWEKRYQPGQADRLYNDAIPTVLQGGKWRGEFGIVTPKGEKKQVLSDWDAVYDDDGGLVCFYGIYTDITSLKILKEKLRQQNQYLNEIIDALPDPLIIKNKDHQWLVVNRAFCQLLGKKRDELIGKNDIDFLSEDLVSSAWALDDEALQSGKEVVSEEIINGADGKPRLLSTKRVPVKGIDGNDSLIGVGRDITKERELQSAIAESYLKLGSSLSVLANDLNRIQGDIVDSVSKSGAINVLFEQCNTNFSKFIKQSELRLTDRGENSIPNAHLSSREYQVFLLLIQGKRIKDIADNLGITPNTASTYRSRVMKKLNISSVAEMIQYAMSIGLV